MTSPKGIVVIHSRPTTAPKKVQSSTPNLLSRDLADLSGHRDQTDNEILAPIYLQGSKVIMKQYKDLPEKKKRDTIDSLEGNFQRIKEETQNSRPRTALQSKQGVRPMSAVETEARKRISSAKMTMGTQTQVEHGIKKIDINGEYFESYTGTPMEGSAEKVKKSVLKSWVSTNNPPYLLQGTVEGNNIILKEGEIGN